MKSPSSCFCAGVNSSAAARPAGTNVANPIVAATQAAHSSFMGISSRVLGARPF